VLRGDSEGLPVPGSWRCSGTDPPQADWSAQPWMAERSQHRASEGLEGRSECPATGMGSPETDTRASIKCDPYYVQTGAHERERRSRNLFPRAPAPKSPPPRRARLVVAGSGTALKILFVSSVTAPLRAKALP